MDLPLLPGGCGGGWSGQRCGAWGELGGDLARRASDVFRLRLLPDAHLPSRARKHLQREPRKRSSACWRISRLNLPPSHTLKKQIPGVKLRERVARVYAHGKRI